MKIVLNEKEIVDKLLENGYDEETTGVTISSVIWMLSKHFLKKGQNANQAFDSIDNFLSKNIKNYKPLNWEEKINESIGKVNKSKKYDLLKISNIIIYKKELEIIKNIDNLRLEKLAFVLLVYAKIFNKMNNNKSNWINVGINADTGNIFSDAKIAIGKNDQWLMIGKLIKMKLVKTSRVVNCTNINVLFVKHSGEIAINIVDFRNFVFEYLRWVEPEKFKECEECGIIIRVTSNHKKFCKVCCKENWSRYNADKQKEYYYKNKDSV